MANTISYSRLQGAGAGFNAMLRGFGVVTVMNAKVFDYDEVCKKVDSSATEPSLEKYKADEILKVLKAHEAAGAQDALKPVCTLKTLKVANVTQEGPTKTITGGQYTNALFKFGKTATMEIQDALGNVDAIEALCGGVVEYFKEQKTAEDHDQHDTDVLHIGSDFGGPKTILGDTFFIDQKTGEQVKVNIIFYQFLPDSIFNLTQDAEGDATVFDMNGSLGTTDITVGTDGKDTGDVVHGVFYSIISPNNVKATV